MVFICHYKQPYVPVLLMNVILILYNSFLQADTVSQMLLVSSGIQKVLNKYLEKKINVEVNFKLILNPFNFRLILN